MTTIEALFDLYQALGGDVDEISTLETIPELLEEISEVAGSTIELPGVTASDNGDVLTVVDGKWAKAEASAPTLSSEDFNIGGLTGSVKTYGNVSTIQVLKKSRTVTSGVNPWVISIPDNLLEQRIPIYQNNKNVGYFFIARGLLTVSVSETLTATADNPVYANFTTL